MVVIICLLLIVVPTIVDRDHRRNQQDFSYERIQITLTDDARTRLINANRDVSILDFYGMDFVYNIEITSSVGSIGQLLITLTVPGRQNVLDAIELLVSSDDVMRADGIYYVPNWGTNMSLWRQFFNTTLRPLLIAIGVVGILLVILLSTIPPARYKVRELDRKEEGK